MDWTEEIKSVFPVGTRMSMKEIRTAIAEKHNDPKLLRNCNLYRSLRLFVAYGYARRIDTYDRHIHNSIVLERIL